MSGLFMRMMTKKYNIIITRIKKEKRLGKKKQDQKNKTIQKLKTKQMDRMIDV